MENKFIDPQTLATLGGASFAVVVVSATARKLMRIDTPWLAFAVAILIAFGGAYHAGSSPFKDLFQCLLTVLNACLIFFTALGLNETVAHTANKPPPGNVAPQSARPKRWFQSMFR